jgi:bacterioferritin-associated ferredoxin
VNDRDELEDRRKPAIQLVEDQAIAVGERGDCSTSAAAERTSGLRLLGCNIQCGQCARTIKQVMSEALDGRSVTEAPVKASSGPFLIKALR